MVSLTSGSALELGFSLMLEGACLGPDCRIRALQQVKGFVWCHDMKDDPKCVRGTKDQTISDMAMTKTTVKLRSGASKDNDNNNNNGDRFRQAIRCFHMRDFQRHCSFFFTLL